MIYTEGFDSYGRPSNLTQIGLKSSISNEIISLIRDQSLENCDIKVKQIESVIFMCTCLQQFRHRQMHSYTDCVLDKNYIDPLQWTMLNEILCSQIHHDFFPHPKFPQTNGIQEKLRGQFVTYPYPRDMFSSKYPSYVIIDQLYWFNSLRQSDTYMRQ